MTSSAIQVYSPLLDATYWIPDSSQLLPMAKNLTEAGLYQKVTLFRETIKVHPETFQRHLCDAICLEKRAIQIVTETALEYLYTPLQSLVKKILCPLASWQKKQREAFENLCSAYRQKLQDWDYEILHHFRDRAGEIHAVLLFYKPTQLPPLKEQ